MSLNSSIETGNSTQKASKPEECLNCPFYNNTPVFGQGNLNAKLVIVGEAPGADEEIRGVPFCGRAGRLLNEVMEFTGINRTETFITNALICRPPSNNIDLPASKKALEICPHLFLSGYLRRIKPDVILTLGKTAADCFFPSKSMKEARSGYRIINNTIVISSYHPAYILRDPFQRQYLEEDLFLAKYALSHAEKIKSKPKYTLVSSIDQLKEFESMAYKSDWISFDIEADNLDTERLNILGISFSIKGYDGWYIPLKVPHPLATIGFSDYWGNNQSKVIQVIKNILENPSIGKIAQNAFFDINALKYNLNISVKNLVFDTMIASHLLDENKSSSLATITNIFSDLKGYKEDTWGNGANRLENLSNLSVEKISEYSCKDADGTFRAAEYYSMLISAYNLDNVLNKISIPLVNILSKMHLRGMLVDTKYAKKLLIDYNCRISDLLQKIYDEVGEVFSPSSDLDLKRILIDKLNIPIPKTEKGNYSFRKETLAEFSKQYPFLNLISEVAHLESLRNTFISGILESLGSDNRVHSKYKITGTRTGRISADKPNLLNIPRNSDIKRMFIVEDGWTMVSADLAQAEVRVLAWVSGDEKLLKACTQGDIYKAMASDIFDIPVNRITREQRQSAKAIVLGTLYGMGIPSMAKEAGISESKATKIYNDFFSTYSRVRRWKNETISHVKRLGYVINPYGRRRRLPNLRSSDKELKARAEREAVNSIIQGGTFDYVALSTIELYNEIKNMPAYLLNIVHDSVILEVRDEYVKDVYDIIKHIFESPKPPIDVTMRVDVTAGKNWGDQNAI